MVMGILYSFALEVINMLLLISVCNEVDYICYSPFALYTSFLGSRAKNRKK